MLTVLTPPASTALTTVAALRRELKLTTEEFDDDLAILIGDATAAIERHTNRVFGRRLVRERLAGSDDVILQLASPLVVAVTQASRCDVPIVDFEIDDPRAGDLYRECGWAGRYPGAEGFRDWTVQYGCGWLLPADDYTSAVVTAETSDKSFTDGAGGFPLLFPGEVIEIVGGENAGRKTIVTATSTKLTFLEAVTSEAAGAEIALRVRTLPPDVERACIATAAAWRQSEGRDPDVASKRVADVTLTYRDAASADVVHALPPRALGLLTPWVLE